MEAEAAEEAAVEAAVEARANRCKEKAAVIGAYLLSAGARD